MKANQYYDVILHCLVQFRHFSSNVAVCSTLNFNPSNVKLNPICHLLALLGAHHILHVSRIRVKGPLVRVVLHEFLELKGLSLGP